MAKMLGEGSFGRCYLTDDFRVLKIFTIAKFINKIDERLIGIKNDINNNINIPNFFFIISLNTFLLLYNYHTYRLQHLILIILMIQNI